MNIFSNMVKRERERQRDQQDATNLLFIIRLLYQHVSSIIMPIIRRTRLCTTAYSVLHWLCWLWLCGAGSQAATQHHSQHNQCRTPYAVVHGLVLLMMGIMMLETCWERSLIINITLVASRWSLSLSLSPSLHLTFMIHGHKSLKFISISRWILLRMRKLRTNL